MNREGAQRYTRGRICQHYLFLRDPSCALVVKFRDHNSHAFILYLLAESEYTIKYPGNTHVVSPYIDLSKFIGGRGSVARKKDVENGQEMRLKFRSAFTKLLKERRWEQITIKEICAEAKVSLGLFYYYFESKEDVMREKCKAFDKALYETVDNLSKGCNLLQGMFLYVSVYIAKCYEKGSNYMAQMIKFYMDDYADHEPWHTGRGVFTIVETLIDRAKAAGEIPGTVDSKNMACEFVSALRGIVIQWCSSNGNYNMTAGTNNLVRFYYLGLRQMEHHVFDSILNTETRTKAPSRTHPVHP